MRNILRILLSLIYLASATLAQAGFIIDPFKFGAAACISTFNAVNSAPTISTTTATATGISIGDAGASGHIIIAVVERSTPSGVRTLNTLTVGGNSATILAQRSVTNENAAIAIVADPGGTTATVVATWNGNIARATIASMSAVNLISTTPVGTIVTGSVVDPSGTVNVSAGGCIFAIANTDNNTAGTTWTGVTEGWDAVQGGSELVSGGRADYAAAVTPQTVTANFVSASSGTNLVAASMR